MSITRLEKFLINRNLLETFKRNQKQYSAISYTRFTNDFTSIPNVIYMAFDWFNTPEGYNYWYKIGAEWKECLKNNTL